LRKPLTILYNRPFLIFLLFVFVAYLPVFLPFFHLKNDLITQNLPTRYIISESLYSGYFPWWNPYIHFGIPQYGDMNNGFWNPILWMIAKTFGYNVWTITFEEMIYILIGGWGIYKIAKELGISKGIALLTGLAYVGCGYITGHLQHFCWITGTGFFPYVLLFFVRINKNPILKNYIGSGISFSLFLSSTHPGIIIGAIYFFAFALAIILVFRKNETRKFFRSQLLLTNFLFILFCVSFSIGVITSNLDVLQHISRGNKVSLSQSLLEPTTFQSYISLLFPLAVNRSDFFATDISMRNVYIGLASLIGVFFIFHFVRKKILLAVTTVLLFFILLSAGSIFKIFFYYSLPLLGYVRLNGEFTYFVILILLFCGAFGLDFLIANKKNEESVKKSINILITISGITILICATTIIFSHSSLLFQDKIIGSNFKITIKNLLDKLTFADMMTASAIIQLLTLFFIKKNIRQPQRFFFIAIINLILNVWLALPFTGLGRASKKEMNKKIFVSPHGIYPQELQPFTKTKFLDSSLKKELQLLGAYSKKIGYPSEESYPVQLRTTKKIFEDSSLHNFINQQSYIFLSDDTIIYTKTYFDSSLIAIKKFGPGYIKAEINNSENHRFITFLQNDYPYWQTFVDKKLVPHYTSFKTFMSAPILQGNHEVEFIFDPQPIRKTIIINAIILIIGLTCLCFPRLRNFRIMK
jgi:hypothetical protein